MSLREATTIVTRHAALNRFLVQFLGTSERFHFPLPRGHFPSMSVPGKFQIRPLVVSKRGDLRTEVAAARRAGKTIGLVPTMGALHAGHGSLAEAARRECGYVVATIFVNPTQFGPGEDFDKYPRTLESDLQCLSERGVDLVFIPSTHEVYQPGHATHVEVGGITERFEGPCRPGHFRGVATVVLKLFNLCAPDVAFFGQKDYQQTLVVRRLVQDLDLPITIRVCPTVREPDGLAMSSRNVYLNPKERQQALVLGRSLRLGAEMAAGGERDASRVLARMRQELEAVPEVRLEYLALVDQDTLADVRTLERPAVALIAARVGNTRLIDNVLIGQ